MDAARGIPGPPGQPPPVDAPGAPVVAIGASAGGLEALREFFTAMPPDSGMAFVIVQHLDPSYESRTAEILTRHSSMAVVEAEDGMPLEANHVYAIPSGKYASLDRDRLKLSAAVANEGIRKPIDFFLVSLADARLDRAVAIILSGSSGADGLRGARAIRAAGGMCMAQDPQTAHFPEMPQGIIDAGLADYVLPVGGMPEALLAYARSARVQASADNEPQPGAEADGLESILKILHVRASSDYRHYKRATVLRRIRRRMGLKSVPDMAAYQKILQDDPKELAQLARDLLISVSSFFRDGEIFEELRRDAVAPLVESKDTDAPLRAWVAGCATGEEAYTVAMLLLDAAAAAGKACPVQVFASDVDDQALETARVGAYPADIEEDVPPEYLKRYFTKQGASWQVGKQLREAVIFSRHNLLVDPPFSRLDLVTCRNVLIYLMPAAQKKVLTLFSFALNPGGYLFLGKSEGLNGVEESLFEAVSKQKRIYRLVRANRRAAGEFPLYSDRRPAALPPRGKVQLPVAALCEATQEALLRHFEAGSVLIDPKGRVLYFYGGMERYLRHPKGPATLNLLDMTEGTLSARLRRAVNKALRQDAPVVISRVPLPNMDASLTDVTVIPLAAPALGGKVLAVIFEDARPSRRADVAAAPPEDESLVAQLEAEVRALREELREDAQEYGSAGEELKAANEEMTSMNEELQSANEELEASKEELQSLNEELGTVNSQLSEKVSELTATNDDLANLLTATQIATVFLDRQFRVKRFTPRATELLNLIPSDIGRPVSHITQNFAGGALAADAAMVMKNLSQVEKEVRAQDGRWLTVRVLPYRTLDDRIEGVVITFSDVTRLKETENRLNYEKAYAESIVETVRNPLIVLDERVRVLSANRAFYEMFRVTRRDTVGQRLYDLGGRQWDIPRLRQLLEEMLPKHESFRDFEVEHDFPEIGHKTLLLDGRSIDATDGSRILLSIEDVTERKKDRQELRALNEGLETRVTERTALAEARAEQLHDLASELTRTEQRERERLARLLHDDLQQLLVGALFHLGQLRSETVDPAARLCVDQVEDLIRQSIGSSRSLTAELSPTILYEAGLRAALPWLARQMKLKHGLDVRMDVNAVVPQDDEGVVLLLFQAVRELLFNIVKHAQVKEARVQVDRLDGGRVCIVVSDDGVGFEPARLEKRGPLDSGMGLFGIRERIKYVGGDVAVDSAPGRGTRVTMTVRVLEPAVAAAPAHAAAPAALPPAAASTAAQKIRVLLVDDHAIMRQGLAGIMRQHDDIQIIAEAADGTQAVEEARRLRPDVVVMDISMPGMNGIEAAKVIHAEFPDIRIIGLSMHEQADGADAMRQAGASAYLTKDGPSDALIDAIRSR